LLRIRVGLASLCFVFGFYRQCGSGDGFCFGVPRWDALKWARAAEYIMIKQLFLCNNYLQILLGSLQQML
ncbi:unnamed protein product, partial [Musa banksii]